MTGSIPTEMGSLVNLKELYLEWTNLGGSIPSQFGNLVSLEIFSAYYSQLTGSIPPQLGNLSNLKILNLSENLLSGSIPIELGSLNNLIDLNLSANGNLTGNIPAELGNLNNLQYLILEVTGLEGSIPVELGNLSNLKALALGFSRLSESIPAQLGNLSNLEHLSISYSQLSGNIPVELGNLTNLKVLYLADNQLNGDLPQELGSLINLEVLDLWGNQLTGQIPVGLTNLIKLRELYLADNHLEGSIPEELESLVNLEQLYLSGNKLSGEMPLAITNLISLELIDTRFNALYSDGQVVNDFINSKPCLYYLCTEDWQYTQTQFPTNIQVIATSDNSISLQWDKGVYPAHGSYEIMMADNIAGPFTQVYETVSKNEVIYTRGDLNPNQNYYFKLTTTTLAHLDNQNTVTSVESEVLSWTTVNNSVSTDLALTLDSIQQTSIQTSNLKANEGKAVNLVNISYTIHVENNSSENIIAAPFIHLIPGDLANFAWTCGNETNGANCPASSGATDINYLLDLPANSAMDFVISGESEDLNSLIIAANIVAPDGYSDINLVDNQIRVNMDVIFENGFE